MALSVQLKAELEDEQVIVTLPGTTFRLSYVKNTDAPGLLQSPIMSNDTTAAISRQEFEALACKAANEKARELGWVGLRPTLASTGVLFITARCGRDPSLPNAGPLVLGLKAIRDRATKRIAKARGRSR